MQARWFPIFPARLAGLRARIRVMKKTVFGPIFHVGHLVQRHTRSSNDNSQLEYP